MGLSQRARISILYVVLALVAIAGGAHTWQRSFEQERTRNARALLGDFRQSPDGRKALELASLLDRQALPRELGNEILLAITASKITTRSSYSSGFQIGVDVTPVYAIKFDSFRPTMAYGFAPSESDSRSHAWNGRDHVVRFTKAMPPGTHTLPITVTHSLFRLQEKRAWQWPSGGFFPWRYIPKYYTWHDEATTASYDAEERIPTTVIVKEPEKAERVKLVSDPNLDRTMKGLFNMHWGNSFTVSAPYGGMACLAHKPLPENVAFLIFYRDENGNRYPLHLNGSPNQADWLAPAATEAWIPVPFQCLHTVLAKGTHKGTLVLVPDEKTAYVMPGIKTIWGGTIEAPMILNIVK